MWAHRIVARWSASPPSVMWRPDDGLPAACEPNPRAQHHSTGPRNSEDARHVSFPQEFYTKSMKAATQARTQGSSMRARRSMDAEP